MPTYIIRAGKDGPVKIGRADDPEGRLRDLQTAHHDRLEIVRIVDTHFDAEPQFHKRFALHRLRGEWFDFVPEMLTFVPILAPEPTVQDIVQKARKDARKEVKSLVEEIWRAFDSWTKRREFVERLATLLQVKKSRAFNIIYDRVQVVEVHELEGLRALARKLRREANLDLGNSVVVEDEQTDWMRGK